MIKTLKPPKTSTYVSVLLLLVFAFSVVVPICVMLSSLTGADISAVLSSEKFGEGVKNSLLLSLIATVIVVLIAYVVAYCMARTKIPFKRLFGILLVLPMLVPSISHGVGLTMLFGNNGIISNAFGLGNIQGPVGIVVGSVLYSFPVAYIMLFDVLTYEDMSVYEAADVLGISRARQFLRITLPYMKKPLIVAAFSTFSMIVTDYGVPMTVGGKTQTLSMLLYKEVIGQLKFGRGAVYAICLLIPAIIAFAADVLNKERAKTGFVKREADNARSWRDNIALIPCILVSVFAILPIIAFVILAFAKKYPTDLGFTLENFKTLFNNYHQGGELLLNSVLMSLIAAAVATVLCYLSAYLSARVKTVPTKIIHLMLLSFMAIPGIVLGLSYSTTFSATPIYGTMLIIVMVNVSHFISSPYLMMYNSLCKMNENLEAVGDTLGIGRARMVIDVFIPQNLGTIAEMFSYVFVNCMMTISAVSFVVKKSTLISLKIAEVSDQVKTYALCAVIALLILVINVAMKLLISLVKTLLKRKGVITK